MSAPRSRSWKRTRAGAASARRLQHWPARNYFAELEPPSKEGHPVDDLMARDPDLRRIGRRALRHLKRLQAHPDWDVLLDFEAERNHLDSARVEAAYNIGFESGLVAGRIEALRIVRGRHRSSEEGALVRQVRSAVAAARTSARRSQAVLLEVAWALALGGPPAPAGARPAGDKRRQPATKRRRP
jgi:hypothetical protein